MRKETEILSHQISNNTVFSILNEPASPFATHITIPTGISACEETTTKQLDLFQIATCLAYLECLNV